MVTSKGWVCPLCNSVFAPHVDECKYCNGKAEYSSTLKEMLEKESKRDPVTVPLKDSDKWPFYIPPITCDGVRRESKN